jgi:hypothetical protein
METVELRRHRSCGPQATRSGAMAWTRRRGAPVVAAPSGGSDELDWRPFPWSTPSTPLSSFPLRSTSTAKRWPPRSLSSGRRHHDRRRGCRGPRQRMCTPGRGENGGEWEENRREREWVVTSPLANTGLSYHIMQATKHEHNNPDYLWPSYQTRAVCIDLACPRLTWLRVSLARS